jgi:nitrate reductase NapE component
MPRQIIDTESSRPAYVRRRITTFVVVAVVLVALAAVAWAIFRSHAG